MPRPAQRQARPPTRTGCRDGGVATPAAIAGAGWVGSVVSVVVASGDASGGASVGASVDGRSVDAGPIEVASVVVGSVVVGSSRRTRTLVPSSAGSGRSWISRSHGDSGRRRVPEPSTLTYAPKPPAVSP